MSGGALMETIVDFIGKVSDMVRDSMNETNSCIGKEFVDTTAGKKGVCVDRITDFFGTKISFLGVRYNKEEQETISKFDADVLVCQTNSGRIFIPMSEIMALGDSIILLKNELKVPEMTSATARKSDVFKRYHLTTEAVKDILPAAIPKSNEKGDKGWLKKLVGE